MSSSVISAILNLKDGMSPKLAQVGRNFDALSAKEKRAAKATMSDINRLQKRAEGFATSALKLGAGLAVAAGGVGFNEAFNLEGYRSQLETATKDTKRAGEVMRYAINLANVTPFEGGEMAKAASVLEMASLKAETYLKTLGDVAAGTNRNIGDLQTQFAKAFSTGQYGEFFDSINVSRQSFKDFVKENKLAANSIAETQVALKKFLDEKFGGGMEKLATTTKGAWSTITGIAKSSLAQLVGMGTDGTVRVGSALDILRSKSQAFSEELVKMQEDGRIDKYAREIGSALTFVFEKGEKVFNILYKYREVVITMTEMAVGIGLVTKAMSTFKAITEITRAATMLLNGTLMLSPWAIIAMAMIPVIGVGMSYASTMQDAANANDILGTSVDSVNGKLAVLQSYFKGGIFSGIGNLLGKGLSMLWNGGVDVANLLISPYTDKRIAYDNFTPVYANGTQYHPGGLALVGERGPEIVNLPRGSKVHTAERSKLGQNSYSITVNINAAQKSDSELADLVAKRIVEELENTW